MGAALAEAEWGEDLTEGVLIVVRKVSGPGGCHECFLRKKISAGIEGR